MRALLVLLLSLLAGCGAARPAAVAPTALASATPLPATATSLPATASPPPATASPAPATASPAPATRRASGPPVRLVIPAINLDRDLVAVGLDRNRVPIVPKHDIGWYNLSAGPGQGENVVLWGHVLRFRSAPQIPAPFARLRELEPGARLTLYSADGSAHPYVVTEQVWATPNQVEYVLPTGRELVTMVSCIGDKVVVDGSVEMTHRLITIAEPLALEARPGQ